MAVIFSAEIAPPFYDALYRGADWVENYPPICGPAGFCLPANGLDTGYYQPRPEWIVRQPVPVFSLVLLVINVVGEEFWWRGLIFLR